MESPSLFCNNGATSLICINRICERKEVGFEMCLLSLIFGRHTNNSKDEDWETEEQISVLEEEEE